MGGTKWSAYPFCGTTSIFVLTQPVRKVTKPVTTWDSNGRLRFRIGTNHIDWASTKRIAMVDLDIRGYQNGYVSTDRTAKDPIIVPAPNISSKWTQKAA